MTVPLAENSVADLADTARRVRGAIVAMSHRSGAAHVGSALSCVDLLLASYRWGIRIDPHSVDRHWADAPGRDRLILSKGHAAAALYAVAAEVGLIPHELLHTFGHNGGKLPEQPAPRCVPGIEAATGSLGHGLSLGVGMALASRIQKLDYRVVVVMSDGECNEGSVWEAAMFAAGRKLEHLTVLVDYNKWQATGRSDEVMSLAPLAEKFTAFGWTAFDINGHDHAALQSAITKLPHASGKPTALICHTVKGRGVSFMEDDNNWHYRVPTATEVERAWQELRLDFSEARLT